MSSTSDEAEMQARMRALQELLPYLPEPFDPAQHQEFQHLVASAPLSQELIRETYAIPEILGQTVIKRIQDADLLAAARDLVLVEVRDLVEGGRQRSLQAGQLIRLQGPNVLFNAVNTGWQHGYRVCLARLDLENRVCGRSPQHSWRAEPAQVIRTVVGRLPEKEEEWAGFRTDARFTASVMLQAVEFLAAQTLKQVAPFYPSDQVMKLRERLYRLVLTGYAIGRAQQEAAVLSEVLTPTRHSSSYV
jgi:hypothetical protein